LSSSSKPKARVEIASDFSPLLDRKMEETTAGLPSSLTRRLLSSGKDNIEIIVKYIAAIKSEVNPSDHYRVDLIALLSRFSKYRDNKPFRDLTRNLSQSLRNHKVIWGNIFPS
jgi:spore coat protein CotH